MQKLILFALLTFLMTAAQAQNLTVRADYKGSTFAHSLDYTAKSGLEVYGLAYDTPAPEYGIGQTAKVYDRKTLSLYAGGYLASWPGPHSVGSIFLQPWLLSVMNFKNLQINLNVAVYVPLNSGPTGISSNDCSALYRVGTTTRLGVAALYWHQIGSSADLRYGPKFNLRLNPSCRLTFAAYAFGGRRPDYRLLLEQKL